MDLKYDDRYVAFRNEVRAFLAENWHLDKAKLSGGRKAYVAKFRKAATAAGHLYRNIPKSLGGAGEGADVLKAQIIREEYASARAPREVSGPGMMMVVPTLLEYGSQEQKKRFIPKTMSGEYKWAQGYSEPGAGSDLASLTTKAELKIDTWIVNGHKIWTTFADKSDFMFALVRTEPNEPKHAGLSYLLFDLKQPGVTIRPLRQMTGGREFCEVHLEDVSTPVDWIVGDRGDGWRVSKSTLKHERNSVGSAAGSLDTFNKLVRLASKTAWDDGRAIDNPVLRDRLASLEGRVLAHLYSGYIQLTRDAHNEPAGIIGLMNKLNSTNIGHEIAAIATDVVGDSGLQMPDFEGDEPPGAERWLNQIFGSLAVAIAGGTSNIQRNIIAERGLNLPREPRLG